MLKFMFYVATGIRGPMRGPAMKLVTNPGFVEWINSVDDNARAFGWEIGAGRAKRAAVIQRSPDNPFPPGWRDKMREDGIDE